MPSGANIWLSLGTCLTIHNALREKGSQGQDVAQGIRTAAAILCCGGCCAVHGAAWDDLKYCNVVILVALPCGNVRTFALQ